MAVVRRRTTLLPEWGGFAYPIVASFLSLPELHPLCWLDANFRPVRSRRCHERIQHVLEVNQTPLPRATWPRHMYLAGRELQEALFTAQYRPRTKNYIDMTIPNDWSTAQTALRWLVTLGYRVFRVYAQEYKPSWCSKGAIQWVRCSPRHMDPPVPLSDSQLEQLQQIFGRKAVAFADLPIEVSPYYPYDSDTSTIFLHITKRISTGNIPSGLINCVDHHVRENIYDGHTLWVGDPTQQDSEHRTLNYRSKNGQCAHRRPPQKRHRST